MPLHQHEIRNSQKLSVLDLGWWGIGIPTAGHAEAIGSERGTTIPLYSLIINML